MSILSTFLGKRVKSASNLSQIVKGDALPKKRSPEALYDFFRGRRSKLLLNRYFAAQWCQIDSELEYCDNNPPFLLQFFEIV